MTTQLQQPRCTCGHAIEDHVEYTCTRYTIAQPGESPWRQKPCPCPGYRPAREAA